jgi:ATP-dependent protease ClpP protease subunit
MNKFNLFGDIVDNDGSKWFESDVTPAMFIGWLNKQDGKDVEINLNSNGGSVSAGLAIANAIKAYPGNVRANVLGLAASMASVIACAADELSLGKGAFLMIHNPWSSTVGTADNLRHEADVLDAMKDSLIGFYLTKFDRTKEELSDLMSAETWIAAEEAERYSLSVVPFAGEDFQAAACLTRRAFAKAPEAARAFFNVHERELPEVPAENGRAVAPATAVPAAEQTVDWEARYKGLSKKLNEANDAHAAELAALRETHAKEIEDVRAADGAELAAIREQNDTFKSQLDAANRDLEKAKADLSIAADRADKAEQDLVAKDEQIALLKSAQLQLTGGVLSPAPASTYADQMAACRTAAEREALREQKRRGKIK